MDGVEAGMRVPDSRSMPISTAAAGEVFQQGRPTDADPAVLRIGRPQTAEGSELEPRWRGSRLLSARRLVDQDGVLERAVVGGAKLRRRYRRQSRHIL